MFWEIVLLLFIALLPKASFARMDPDLQESKVAIECKSLKEGEVKACARLPSQDFQCINKLNTWAFIKNSCIADGAFTLIPEFKKAISKNVEINEALISKYSSVQIAENLVYRYYLDYELPAMKDDDVKNPAYPFHQRVDIQLAFNYSKLDKIVKNGLLNQHRTGASNGALSNEKRLLVEQDMLNFEMPAYSYLTAKNLLPKYSFAVPTQVAEVGLSGSSYGSWYGEIFAVLNDSVRKRATFTVGDSLARNFSSKDFKDVREIHSFYWLQKEAISNGNQFYWETQIWGELSLKDVKYFLVNCYTSSLDQEMIQNLYEKTHIPVYSCKSGGTDQNLHYERNQRLKPET